MVLILRHLLYRDLSSEQLVRTEREVVVAGCWKPVICRVTVD